MTPRRREEYARLDQVGFDVIEALLSKEGSSARELARGYGVSEFNLRLWRRYRRTELFLSELDQLDLLDMIGDGATVAGIARDNDLSLNILDAWIRKNVAAEDIEHARELAADAQFERTKAEIDTADEQFHVTRSLARHGIEKFQAERTTRKYTDERSIRVQAPSGVIFSVNTGHLDPEIAQPKAAEDAK
jgi:hypothetical protein